MGDGQKGDLRVDFDRRVKLTFLGSKVTTDAGLLAYRELDEVLGLTEMAEDLLCDSRLGSNKQHQLVPLLRQSIYVPFASGDALDLSRELLGLAVKMPVLSPTADVQPDISHLVPRC